MDRYELIQPGFKEAGPARTRIWRRLQRVFAGPRGRFGSGIATSFFFSDLPNNRVMRWSESGGLSIFRAEIAISRTATPATARDVVSCSTGPPHPPHRTRREHHPLVERYEGKRLNSPNDIVVKSDGTIWFSDPHYGIQTDYEGGKQEAELPANVYRFDPRDGSLIVVADDFQGPNGLCFSPDERRLYVVETGLQFATQPIQHIRVFDVRDDGRLANGRVFCTISPGNADGIRCDEEGHLWSSAGDGVHCLDPGGELLGKILVPSTVANFTFGGRNRSRLFLCADAERLRHLHERARGEPSVSGVRPSCGSTEQSPISTGRKPSTATISASCARGRPSRCRLPKPKRWVCRGVACGCGSGRSTSPSCSRCAGGALPR